MIIKKDSKLIVCNDKKFIGGKEGLGTNEYELDDGYSCLLNLKQPGLYRIKLHFSDITDLNKALIKSNETHFYVYYIFSYNVFRPVKAETLSTRKTRNIVLSDKIVNF